MRPFKRYRSADFDSYVYSLYRPDEVRARESDVLGGIFKRVDVGVKVNLLEWSHFMGASAIIYPWFIDLDTYFTAHDSLVFGEGIVRYPKDARFFHEPIPDALQAHTAVFGVFNSNTDDTSHVDMFMLHRGSISDVRWDLSIFQPLRPESLTIQLAKFQGKIYSRLLAALVHSGVDIRSARPCQSMTMNYIKCGGVIENAKLCALTPAATLAAAALQRSKRDSTFMNGNELAEFVLVACRNYAETTGIAAWLLHGSSSSACPRSVATTDKRTQRRLSASEARELLEPMRSTKSHLTTSSFDAHTHTSPLALCPRYIEHFVHHIFRGVDMHPIRAAAQKTWGECNSDWNRKEPSRFPKP